MRAARHHGPKHAVKYKEDAKTLMEMLERKGQLQGMTSKWKPSYIRHMKIACDINSDQGYLAKDINLVARKFFYHCIGLSTVCECFISSMWNSDYHMQEIGEHNERDRITIKLSQ